MTYAVKQDLIDRFGLVELVQLTDRTNVPQTTVDDTVVGRALADADQTIDGYLQSAGLQLPLAPVPALLVRLACDIARYFLHKDGPTDVVRKNYEDALKMLRDIANGTIQLQVAGQAPAVSGGAVQIDAPDRTFSRETLGDFA
ncbi:gp436 family protein [Hypericibacter sp.]|uniref:gp436 family protein n=1 Tax=Hypericibacter sp. TaxID=2705401 RepID=UPI003D6D2005